MFGFFEALARHFDERIFGWDCRRNPVLFIFPRPTLKICAAGRGFIALAAVILGKWRPVPTVLACLFFGFTDAIQIRLQGVILWGDQPVPVQWIQVLPYVITIVVLAGFVGRSYAPASLGKVDA